MLRTTLKQCSSKSLLARKSRPPVLVGEKSSSTSSQGKSGLGKVIVTLLGGSVAATAGTLAYAKYDLSFRKQIQEVIPSQILDAALGPAASDSPAPLKQKPESPPGSLLTKKLERDSKKDPFPAGSSREKPSHLTPLPSPPLEKPASVIVPNAVEASKVTDGGKDGSEKKEKSKEQKTQSHLDSSKISQAQASKSTPSPTATASESVSSAGVNPSSSLAPKSHPNSLSTSSSSKSEADYKLGDLTDLPIELQNRIRAELTEQLKIQFSAYNDYLHEQLALQEQEIRRLHQMAMEERVLEEKMSQQRSLADSIARLQEIEQVLSVRLKLDKEEASLKHLWLLCQELNDALKSNPSTGISGDPKKVINQNVVPLLEDIISSENTNSLVKLAVESIASKKNELVENGLYSEDALIERFKQVDRMARRMSLIGSEGGSLWQYILSYTRSFLIIDSVKGLTTEELADEPVDTSKWDTHDILARVRYYLSHRNLEMSLRYANQLQGQPRKIAADWIKDVRTHLEIRQAASLIQAQASSVSLRTLGS